MYCNYQEIPPDPCIVTMTDQARNFRVIHAYLTPYPGSIAFEKGELVEIDEEFTNDPDWKNWVWCRGAGQKQAWAPIQYLQISEKSGKFLQSYDARELSLEVGEKILVYEEINGFGMAQKGNGEKGWVPLRNLEEIT